MAVPQTSLMRRAKLLRSTAIRGSAYTSIKVDFWREQVLERRYAALIAALALIASSAAANASMETITFTGTLLGGPADGVHGSLTIDPTLNNYAISDCIAPVVCAQYTTQNGAPYSSSNPQVFSGSVTDGTHTVVLGGGNDNGAYDQQDVVLSNSGGFGAYELTVYSFLPGTAISGFLDINLTGNIFTGSGVALDQTFNVDPTNTGCTPTASAYACGDIQSATVVPGSTINERFALNSITVSPVPLPAGLPLLGCGLAALLALAMPRGNGHSYQIAVS
jgi:hypothetical protein